MANVPYKQHRKEPRLPEINSQGGWRSGGPAGREKPPWSARDAPFRVEQGGPCSNLTRLQVRLTRGDHTLPLGSDTEARITSVTVDQIAEIPSPEKGHCTIVCSVLNQAKFTPTAENCETNPGVIFAACLSPARGSFRA